MVVDPYSPCLCGSGQKYKWCCQKGEAFIERSLRHIEKKHFDAALTAIDEGLKKNPTNTTLLIQKADVLLYQKNVDEAENIYRSILTRMPEHPLVLGQITRLTLLKEGAVAGAAILQQTLGRVSEEQRRAFAPLVALIARELLRARHVKAAVEHARLAQKFAAGDEGSEAASLAVALERSTEVALCNRNRDEFSPTPADLTGESRRLFEEALGWANQGLWSSAAAAFATLTSEPSASLAAERNYGLCSLFIADRKAAIASLRRAVGLLLDSNEAVELEALCQENEDWRSDDRVEHVQLTWPLKDREGLLARLNVDSACLQTETEDEDEDEEEQEQSPDTSKPLTYLFFNLPLLKSFPDEIDLSRLPRCVGTIIVEQDSVILDTFDDGRLDGLSDRFVTLAGTAIPPAHPRTRVVDRPSRESVSHLLLWQQIETDDQSRLAKFRQAQHRYVIEEAWLNTPYSRLKGKTPLQAVGIPELVVPLRAMVLRAESRDFGFDTEYDFAALRRRLQLPDEPAIDPKTVDVRKLNLIRLHEVAVEELPDLMLGVCFEIALRYRISRLLVRTARALDARPDAIRAADISTYSVYSSLAVIEDAHGRSAEALELVNRGRKAERPEEGPGNAVRWDFLEIRIKMRSERPEDWVGQLAVVMERYRQSPTQNTQVLSSLIELGLASPVSVPERPGEIAIDVSLLRALLAQYGPRVTTASGQLGVSAANPQIWTPGSTGPANTGGLWTPGATSSAGPDGGKKLIITGQ